jgi:DNA-binding response OmpR family regulator
MKSGSGKILIIEDEKPLARALELKLVHEGFEVITLSSGEGFWDYIEKGKIFLIICDLVMPKFDGFQILEKLKENEIQIPVIVLTNLGQTEDEKRVRKLGANEFFVKSDTSLSKLVDYIKNKI